MATRLRAQRLPRTVRVEALRVPPGACHRCAPPKRLTTEYERSEVRGRRSESRARGVARFARKPCCSERGPNTAWQASCGTQRFKFAVRNGQVTDAKGLRDFGPVAKRSVSFRPDASGFRNFPFRSVLFRWVPLGPRPLRASCSEHVSGNAEPGTRTDLLLRGAHGVRSADFGLGISEVSGKLGKLGRLHSRPLALFAKFAARNPEEPARQWLTDFGAVVKRSVSFRPDASGFRNFPFRSVSFRSAGPLSAGVRAAAVLGRRLREPSNDLPGRRRGGKLSVSGQSP